ncbi:MAG: response regulator [Candidatus Omnitrophica bacterium]|nr:response regulator [Candidatus Omnitrophota bacterium]
MPKILIVNDVAIVNKIIKKKLEQEEGFSVDTVLTGNEGIAKALENSYDIFLLDYYLPDINGDKVCEAIKASLNGQKPIYFTSSMDKTSMAEVIQKTGAQGYMDLAMDVDELAKQLKALTSRA